MNFKAHVLIAALVLSSLQSVFCLLGCGVYDDHPSKEKLTRCSEVIELLEDALLSNKINLHIIREAFLSGTSPPPSLLGVTYQISNYTVDVEWSSSRVFTFIYPTVIHALLPGIMTLIYYIEGISFFQTINLYLEVKIDKVLDFSVEEFEYAVMRLTERLKAYAVQQGPLTEWDGCNKGFVIFQASLSWSITAVNIIIPMAMVFLSIAGIAFSFRAIAKLSNLDQSHQAHVKISLFWSFITVLQFTNIVEVSFDVVMLIMLPKASLMYVAWRISDSGLLSLKILLIIKLISVLIMGALGVCLGATCDKRRLPPNPQSRKMCSCSRSDNSNVDHVRALCNIFLFVFFASSSIIPTAALLFVHPILVLSTIAYIVTSIFSMAAVFALPSSFRMMLDRWKAHRNDNEFKRSCAYLCDYILYIIVIIAGNLLMLAFLIILSSSDNTHTTDIFQDASSFLPSVLLGAVGYFAKKRLVAKSKEKHGMAEDLIEASHKHTTASLKSAEEAGIVTNSSDDEVNDDNGQEMVKLLPRVEETQL